MYCSGHAHKTQVELAPVHCRERAREETKREGCCSAHADWENETRHPEAVLGVAAFPARVAVCTVAAERLPATFSGHRRLTGLAAC